jgi:hypothetical protein
MSGPGQPPVPKRIQCTAVPQSGLPARVLVVCRPRGSRPTTSTRADTLHSRAMASSHGGPGCLRTAKVQANHHADMLHSRALASFEEGSGCLQTAGVQAQPPVPKRTPCTAVPGRHYYLLAPRAWGQAMHSRARASLLSAYAPQGGQAN